MFSRVLPGVQQAFSGAGATGIAGAASGLLNIGAQALMMDDAADAINVDAPQQQFDMSGRPVYNLGQYEQAVNTIKPYGATGGEYANAIGQGVMAGAAFGPIGMGVGALIGAGATLLGGRARKRKMEDKLELGQRRLMNQQDAYNLRTAQYNDQQTYAESDANKINWNARFANLYGVPRLGPFGI
jgi:hypothetical protein